MQAVHHVPEIDCETHLPQHTFQSKSSRLIPAPPLELRVDQNSEFLLSIVVFQIEIAVDSVLLSELAERD